MKFHFDATRYALRVPRFTWRLAILLLPWQARWFSEGPLVNGWPWEQGRISFYLSWLPMLATIFFARSFFKKGKWLVGGLVLMLFPLLFTLSSRATTQWFMEAAILVLFALSLKRLEVAREELATWFAASLVPHALLALWQFYVQTVAGFAWLGISSQDPLTLGVSVVETTGRRWLRSYGGFPHPNIFGGWLAVALTVLFTFKRNIFMLALIALFSSALVLTFSRSAWLAAAVGILLFSLKERRVRVVPLLAMFLVVFFAGWMARAPLLARVDPSARLETKSINERAFAWKQGWELFREHPLVGIGPNATILALSKKEPWNKNDVTLGPPIPPHNVPQLALMELGIFGVLGIILLFRFFVVPPLTLYATRIALYVFLILSLLDHYPWSLWSGKSLAVIAILLTFLPI